MKDYFVSLALLALMFLLGVSVNRILKQRSTPTLALVVGFLTLNASFFLIEFPFKLLGLRASLLFKVYSVFLAAALLLGFVLLLRKGLYKEYLHSVTDFFSDKALLKAVILLLILVLFVLTFRLSLTENPDYDDSFYLPKIMEFLKNDSLQLTNDQIRNGWRTAESRMETGLTSREALYAYFSVIFGIPVTILCRKALIISFSVIVYCTVFNLGLSIFRDQAGKLKALGMLLFYMLLCYLYNAVFDSVPYRQIFSMWHGKTIVCTIVFPCIIMLLMNIFCNSDRVDIPDWVLLVLVLLTSFSEADCGINITAICCVVTAAPFLIFSLIKKQNIMPVIKPLLVLVVPALCALPILLKHFQSSIGSAAPPDAFGTFYLMFVSDSSGVVFLLFAAALIYFLIRGTVHQRLLLAAPSVFLALTFLNPLFIGFVSKYLTTSTIYWRQYWIFPIWTIVPAAMVALISEIGPRQLNAFMKGGAFAAAFFLLVVLSYSGLSILKNPGYLVRCWFPQRINAYALPQECITVADAVLADSDSELPVLLDAVGYEGGKTYGQLYPIRQYSVDIGLCVDVRNTDISGELISDSEVSVRDLITGLRQGTACSDPELLLSALEQLKADYLFADSELLPQNDCLVSILSAGSHHLYRVELPK